MSVEREERGGPIVFVCDACPETLETGYTTWGYANDARRDEGWTAEPLGTTGARGAEEWAHYCPACGSRSKVGDFRARK